MKVTLLGHASILVELDGATCLMDPVFSDPFEEGAVVSCPQRTVYPDRLPPIDLLIVSHRHPDHFHIPSLARVSRDADAICPVDPLIVYALEKLGFTHIHPVYPMGPILSPDYELYPTQSASTTVKEFGMLFKDRSGTFWNQVDTFLTPETIDAVTKRFNGIDLLFAMYASQNLEFFESRSTHFPYAQHGRNLAAALQINPNLVAPGAAGFRFCGDHAWLNAFLFPISRERFLSDLKDLRPHLATQIMNPGDTFILEDGQVSYQPGASEIAVMELEDTYRLQFDPSAPIPALTDPNPDGYSHRHLTQSVARFITQGMVSYVQQGYQTSDKVVSLYRDHRVSYRITIAFPRAENKSYRFEFGESDVRLITGNNAEEPADMTHRIAASALVGWLEYTKSFFYVRAYSRRSGTVYELSEGDGKVKIQPKTLPDLLMHYLLNESPQSQLAARHQIDGEVRAALS